MLHIFWGRCIEVDYFAKKNFMYSREQESKTRQKFWTSFGQYMKPVPGYYGEQVNWLNYKTGIGNIYFKMDAARDKAVIVIEITHVNSADRMRYYQQFSPLKKLLEQQGAFSWKWEPVFEKETGGIINRISDTLYNVNVMNEADWPAIIVFLKPRIIALDAFWQTVKDGFE